MTPEDMKFFEDLFRSLEREVRQEFALLHEKIDRYEARLTRLGGVVNGGARQIARLVEWSEKVDAMLADRDAKITDLERRLRKLEAQRGEVT